LVVTGPLLIVFHSRSGGTQRLVDAAVTGAAMASEASEALVVKHAFDTGADDVESAGGILIATPANFGYMSGAVKDLFERIYHQCLDVTVGKPYSMIVKGDTDVAGAAESVRRIATGMRWREVLPPLLVVGAIEDDQLGIAEELGATFAAGIELGIY
jgi:multimeric flavodoxin WrbA